MRVAVVDIGTNSTRLLVADVDEGGALTEVERRTEVTRLGQGVDRSGVLADDAMQRVHATLAAYRRRIDALGARRAVAVLTSAVRDAANGAEFTARVRDEHGLDARTIDGDEEARLTFLGATSSRPPDDLTPTVVIDIGGGSTELVVGSARRVTFHVSTQVGVVRHSERHIHTDPPRSEELDALAADVRATLAASVPPEVRASARAAIAVAGTPTSLAAIDLDLECHSPDRVHRHVLTLEACGRMLTRLAALPEPERRQVRGLHPDRAPTIVAGTAMLIEALRLFDLQATEVSDQDILHGAALEAVHRARGDGAAAPD
ncbi:MAG: exopolyphosphatase / guanosine-5-triphosphate,3-diphosphate pyrophosphatase [Solirubrobacteraceae bacterium]